MKVLILFFSLGIKSKNNVLHIKSLKKNSEIIRHMQSLSIYELILLQEYLF